jgi:hypothetical protein
VTGEPPFPELVKLAALPLLATTNVENDVFVDDDVLLFPVRTVTVYEVPGVTVMLFTQAIPPPPPPPPPKEAKTFDPTQGQKNVHV